MSADDRGAGLWKVLGAPLSLAVVGVYLVLAVATLVLRVLFVAVASRTFGRWRNTTQVVGHPRRPDVQVAGDRLVLLGADDVTPE